ncbi:MAG: peptide chain release factor aRF-1, partial [Nitrososphaeraceae archaeon]
KGLVISGPGPTKENFIREEYLEYRLQNMIIATLDTSYAGSEGVREAFARAQEVLSDYRMVEEKKFVEKLFEDINSPKGFAVYGLNDIIDLLKRNVVSLVLITDDTNLRKVDITCKRCQNVQTEILERAKVISRIQELLSSPCPNCKSMDSESAERDIVDYLALLAGETGAKVEVISGITEHGTMLSSIGKVGAFLRYNPNQ